MWDITWLPGPAKGVYYYLYLILDLFSRKVIALEIWPEESDENASVLIRGAIMPETLYALGIIPSRSRPRVSNDNPYAESIFRTCKYRPSFPTKGFLTIDVARKWVLEFTYWYNFKHRHSGLEFITPHQRHSGQAEKIFNDRQKVYEAAKDNNPHRWSKDTRTWQLDDIVWLNPEKINSENSVTTKVL